MNVTRIHTATGSHIEPPLEPEWSDFKKLLWHATVVEADTGIRLVVTEGGMKRRQSDGGWAAVPGAYTIAYGNGSISAFDFERAWSFINGVTLGAELAAKRTEESA
jgi:hypothetical protein